MLESHPTLNALTVFGQWDQKYFSTCVEQSHNLPSDKSYNLSFKQPGFLFDKFDTSQVVVYNPKDEHKVYCHTSWFLLLAPEELESNIRPI
jgi:hypothetical protein